MLTQYHIEIMFEALGKQFGTRALSEIIYANARQDRLAGMYGHDEYHCDNNAFEKTYAYIAEQRALIAPALQNQNTLAAWEAFGRLLHSVQDFYAHSNYITLWLDRYEGQTIPAPPKIDPLDPELINSPSLRSGKVYYPFELLYFMRSTRAFSLRWLPKDSHAWMNLDSPEQGYKFEYAMQAAIKRTVIEYERTTEKFSEVMCRLFCAE
jgi:hypothetical protein